MHTVAKHKNLGAAMSSLVRSHPLDSKRSDACPITLGLRNTGCTMASISPMLPSRRTLQCLRLSPSPNPTPFQHHRCLPEPDHRKNEFDSFGNADRRLLSTRALRGEFVQRGIAFGDACSRVEKGKAFRVASSDPRKSLVLKGGEEEEKDVSLLRTIVWGVYSLYILWLLLLPFAPGDPVWNIQPETLQDISDLSLNFFFILPTLNSVGIDYMKAPDIHPMSEALFNFVNAWSLMFGPILFSEPRNKFVKVSLEGIWIGVIFLTNIFLIPYMALRLDTESSQSNSSSSWIQNSVVKAARWLGLTGLIVGSISIFWGIFARAENGSYGDLSERVHFLVQTFQTDRVSYAFLFDLILYTIFQAWLITDVGKKQSVDKLEGTASWYTYLRFIPFFGLAAFLITIHDDLNDQK